MNTIKKINILVLIVEDDKYMNETLCEVLIAEGYDVETALTAFDALNKVKHSGKKYDLLILDYNLQHPQGITGIDIYREAKQVNPATQAIMISAYGDKKIKERAREAGIKNFVDKPFLITDLMDSVDELRRNISQGKYNNTIQFNY